MRVVLQRVQEAAAYLDVERVASIGKGLVLFVGMGRGDDEAVVEKLARKIVNLRVFETEGSKFGLSALDAGAQVLTVSQLTLMADTVRGRKPNFSRAAQPEVAERLYRFLGACLRDEGVGRVEVAPFRTRLVVDVKNWGPFTVALDSERP
jgi:D-tyrosyl-tRNA(Tyr) deacylase